MSVDEQTKRAWRKLIGQDYDDTPDPATHPWEWVRRSSDAHLPARAPVGTYRPRIGST